MAVPSGSKRPSRSVGRRVGYASLLVLSALALLEGTLRGWERLERPRVNLQTATGDVAVIAVGDSVTQGALLPEAASWPNQLKPQVSAKVVPYGRSGMGTNIVPEILVALQTLPSSTTPHAVVMLGHNDFLFWENYEVQLEADPAKSEPPSGAKSAFFVLRAVQWLQSANYVPKLQLDPARVSVYRQGLRTLRDAVRARGGTMWLCTYLIPGEPGPDMLPRLAQVVRYTRSGQALINREIRTTATMLGVPLIDLESDITVSETFDEMLFLDQIHLTAAGLALVARRVDQELDRAGLP